jgi:glycosyltransferase involved in cell wall biosynthesis
MAKKKILLLSDDLRMASGIATMSKELVLGTIHKYDWFQVGAAINHPEAGKILDVSEDIQKNYGVADASLKILPWNGYGNADLIRQLINVEKPDAIVHFTDPRYWTWLYDIEHEIRQNVPLLFYAIWDDLPDPLYNRNFYESCDWIGCISRQTYGIIKRLSALDTKPTWKPKADWQVSYVPHGINTDLYKPTEVPAEYRKEILGDKEYDFVLYWSNRNIRRKQPADVIVAFQRFCDRIGKEKADKCVLLMHTQTVDENGTDLPAVIDAVAPNCNIIFSEKRRLQHELNYNYNLSDATINIANNEGFGLATAESVMAGVPIIVNVTGGLQDQCGFEVDGKMLTADDYIEIGSLHEWRKWEGKAKSGPWAIPVWSRAQALAGSVPTPYIWDDRVDIDDVAEAIEKMYNTPKEVRKANAELGRQAFIGEMGLTHTNMCKQLENGIESVFENWKPRERFEVFKIK